MDKNQFWNIVENAKNTCGDDLEAYEMYIKDSLKTLHPKEIQDFQVILRAYVSFANKFGLWTAAQIMSRYCSDDGFIDFRCWLVSKGKDIYFNALKDPNSLASVELQGRNCKFEVFMYASTYVYKECTGRDLYSDLDPKYENMIRDKLLEDIIYDEGIEYPYTWAQAKLYLPALCQKYMSPEQLEKAIRKQNDPWSTTHNSILEARNRYKPGVHTL